MDNSLCRETRPAICKDASEALILVVGNDAKCNLRVARDLAEARGATEGHLTEAGVRFFTRKACPHDPVVMETAPLKTVPNVSRVDTARVWISQNSLRQLSGKAVFVVCVLSSSDATDEIYREPNFTQNQFSWLHVLTCVFDKNRQNIVILVKSEGSTDDASKQRLWQVLIRDGFGRQENVIFVTSKRKYAKSPLAETILQSSVDRSNADDARTIENGIKAMSPFRLPRVAESGADQFGPWGPENVILFGISGSGKSTLAKMLTTGRLDGVDYLSNFFPTSSGVQRATKIVNVGQGRGWRVFDTPGLGESSEDGKSGVSTDRAGKLIREYIMLVQGVYSHFLFVMKKDRVSENDTALWAIFNKMFHAEGVQNHMTVVVSGADREWINNNISHLKKCFEGCDSFLPADFPLLESDVDWDGEADREIQQELHKIRLQSLKALEEDLASLCRLDVSCRLGVWSVGTQRSLMERVWDRTFSFGTHMRQTAAFGPSTGKPQPSNYETARTVIRFKSFGTQSFPPGLKLELWPPLSDYETARTQYMSEITLIPPGKKSQRSDVDQERPVSESESVKDNPFIFRKSQLRGALPVNASEGRAKFLSSKQKEITALPKFGLWSGITQISEKETNVEIDTLEKRTRTRDATPDYKLLKDFIAAIEERAEDGFFVSSEWLLRFQEEIPALMSVLEGAGYCEACQTSTTTLFAKFENDGGGAFVPTGKIVDNLPGEMLGLKMDNIPEIANVSSSKNEGKSSSAIDDAKQVATWEAFQVATKSKWQESFCVSTQWLSNLKEQDKEALLQSSRKAEYVQISQTSNTTWYVKMRGSLVGPVGADDGSRSCTSSNSASGNVRKPRIWSWLRWPGAKRNANGEDDEKSSSGPENRVETGPIPNGTIPVCRPQLLKVECSSSSSLTVLQAIEDLNADFSTYQFGESVVTIPRMGPSQNISTSMEKPFSISKIEFTGDISREATMELKAVATTSLSCCVKMDCDLQKVRVKFSQICGQARNVIPEEEWCNAMVVSSVYTSVCGRSKTSTDGGYNMEPIILFLDEEYCRQGGRRVSEGDVSGGDLVWMEKSGRTPENCEPGSTTVVLQRDIDSTRLKDSRRPVQGAHPLLFQSPSPVAFEGEVNSAHHAQPGSFLQFRIRCQLQVSYFKPSRAIEEGGPVWFAVNTTKLVDFGCFITITTPIQ